MKSKEWFNYVIEGARAQRLGYSKDLHPYTAAEDAYAKKYWEQGWEQSLKESELQQKKDSVKCGVPWWETPEGSKLCSEAYQKALALEFEEEDPHKRKEPTVQQVYAALRAYWGDDDGNYNWARMKLAVEAALNSKEE